MFVPSNLVEWRCNNAEEKEPETIEWIKKFNSSNKKINFGILELTLAFILYLHPNIMKIKFRLLHLNLLY